MTTSFTTHFRFGLPDFLSSPWQADWYTLVQLMDKVLYEVALGTIISVWANSTTYVVGNIRIDPNLGTIWTCLVAHTSAASPTTFTTDRANHPTFWGSFTSVDGDKGYITVSGSNSVYTINDGVVSNAKLSDMGQATFKMRAAGAGTGVPIDGTAAQAKTALAITFGDITGFGAGVSAWLTTPSSANLLAAVTDETGTGALVFGTAPALTSPTITTKVSPTANDGAPLGDTTHNFSDLFLASGGVINWNNGDVLVTHSTDSLTFSGASNGYFYDAAVKPNANDSAALGASGDAWSDIFLASGAVINFNAGDVTITHGTDLVTFGGAANGYAFDNVVKPTTNNGASLGLVGTAWANLFLATGGVINWNNGDFTITESATQLNFGTTPGNLYLFNSTFGYGAGSGGSVTQATSKTTNVTLNKPAGAITMNNAALAANTLVVFNITNSFIGANDLMVMQQGAAGTGTFGAYSIQAQCAAGSANIAVRNISAGSLSEAIVLEFVIIKGSIT